MDGMIARWLDQGGPDWLSSLGKDNFMIDINIIPQNLKWAKEQVAKQNDESPIDKILVADCRLGRDAGYVGSSHII